MIAEVINMNTLEKVWVRNIRDQQNELILQGIDDAGRQWYSEKVCEQ
jgi:hypothetical protein